VVREEFLGSIDSDYQRILVKNEIDIVGEFDTMTGSENQSLTQFGSQHSRICHFSHKTRTFALSFVKVR